MATFAIMHMHKSLQQRYTSKHQSRPRRLSRSTKRKREGKSPFLKGCWACFSGLPRHLSGLGTGIELCWLAPPIAVLKIHTVQPIDSVQCRYNNTIRYRNFTPYTAWAVQAESLADATNLLSTSP